MDEGKIKQSITKFIQVILKNYQQENPAYIGNSNNLADKEFGISNNYIMLLLFDLDKDLCALKIFF